MRVEVFINLDERENIVYSRWIPLDFDSKGEGVMNVLLSVKLCEELKKWHIFPGKTSLAEYVKHLDLAQEVKITPEGVEIPVDRLMIRARDLVETVIVNGYVQIDILPSGSGELAKINNELQLLTYPGLCVVVHLRLTLISQIDSTKGEIIKQHIASLINKLIPKFAFENTRVWKVPSWVESEAADQIVLCGSEELCEAMFTFAREVNKFINKFDE
jgi:hypothetical protein